MLPLLAVFVSLGRQGGEGGGLQGIVTFARSDICANNICTKWKGTKLGEAERD